MNRKEAIEYIFLNEQGRKDDLLQSIGQYFFDNFSLLGYIECGVSDRGEEMYRRTNLGKDQYTLYKAPTKEEAEWGIYYYAIS